MQQQSPKQTAGRSHVLGMQRDSLCQHSVYPFGIFMCLQTEYLVPHQRGSFLGSEPLSSVASWPLCSVEMQDVPLCVSRQVYCSASGGFLHTCVHCSQTLSWLCFPEADPKLADAQMSLPSNCCRIWNKLSIMIQGWEHSKKSHSFTHAHTHTQTQIYSKDSLSKGYGDYFVQQTAHKNNTVLSEEGKLTSGMMAWQYLFWRVGVHPHPMCLCLQSCLLIQFICSVQGELLLQDFSDLWIYFKGCSFLSSFSQMHSIDDRFESNTGQFLYT